jgi:hypothetical protein
LSSHQKAVSYTAVTKSSKIWAQISKIWAQISKIWAACGGHRDPLAACCADDRGVGCPLRVEMYGEHAGGLLTADGTDDDKIKLEGTPRGYEIQI